MFDPVALFNSGMIRDRWNKLDAIQKGRWQVLFVIFCCLLPVVPTDFQRYHAEGKLLYQPILQETFSWILYGWLLRAFYTGRLAARKILTYVFGLGTVLGVLSIVCIAILLLCNRITDSTVLPTVIRAVPALILFSLCGWILLYSKSAKAFLRSQYDQTVEGWLANQRRSKADPTGENRPK